MHRRDLGAEWSRRTVRQDAERLANAFLYLSRVSPNYWEHAYRNSNLKHQSTDTSLGNFPHEIVYVKPRFVKLCFAMMSGRLIPQTPGINKGRKLIYLGASTCDTGHMGFDPESRETENVYELIPDENSTVRRNYLRTLCAQEEEEF